MKRYASILLVLFVYGADLYPMQKARSFLTAELEAFKKLPQHLQACLINRSCSAEQKRAIVSAAKKVGYAAVTLAAVGAAIYATYRLQSQKTQSIKKIAFDRLSPKDQNSMANNMVTAITSRDLNYIRNGTPSQIAFNQEQLDSYILLAVPTSSPEIVAWLLKQGASPSAKDLENRSLLYWAARRATSGGTEGEYGSRIVDLLLASGAPVNLQGKGEDDGKTALIFAAGIGDEKLINKLLAHGARKDLRDDEGKTAYDYAPPSLKLKLGYKPKEKMD